MKAKKILFALFIAIVGILGFTNVNAATISENGEYSLVLEVDGLDDSNIEGEYAKLIRFNVDEGETTVNISELTKGIVPFNGKNEFSHWVNSSGEKVGKELSLTNFTGSGYFYMSTGEKVNYTNGVILKAKFEGKALDETDNYYVTFDAFGGAVNGKSQILLTSASNEFKTIDLTKYTPVRKGYTFKGWNLNGKLVTSIDSSCFTKNVITLTATYTKDTFDGTDRVLILNANGGTISGKESSKYDYLGGGNSGTAMSLLPYVPERKGYIFNGWNSKQDGSGKNYKYIYWRRWDKDDEDDLNRDTIIKNELGAEYYQNVTLYASWIKNSEEPQETVKEIQSTGEINGKIEFADGVNKNYKLDIKPTEVKKDLADKNVKYLVDINILENGQIVEINGMKMKIKIALPEDLKGYKKYEVVYILNDEIKETIPATIEDGYIVFETSHLSQYGIIATEKSSNVNVENPKTGDNIMMYLAMGILSIIGLVGASVIVYRKKQTN